MQYGFIKVASAIPSVIVADCTSNIKEIKRLIDQATIQDAAIVCFPELSITAYTCNDLFSQQTLLRSSQSALQWLLDNNDSSIIAILGMPLEVQSMLFNVAVVIQGNRILGIVPKTYLPNYKEFYEQRWFASATCLENTSTQLCGQEVPISKDLIFDIDGDARFGIEICEDVWAPIPPSTGLALQGADIIFNLSASNEVIGKNQYLRSLLAQQSARCICGYVYSSCGFGESTQDVVYGGNAYIYENGKLLVSAQRFLLEPQMSIADIDVERIRMERRSNTTFAESVRNYNSTFHASRFTLHASRSTLHTPHPTLHAPHPTLHEEKPYELSRWVNPHPFVPAGKELDERCEEIFSIQVNALSKRIVHTHAKTVVLGISGGLDSTLALLVCVRTMDKLSRPRTDIVGITMPGFGTTDRTYNNAIALMKNLGITTREISIREACIQHFKDIEHNMENHDVTYENSQARERTQILMDVANQMNGFVVGTGDLSELALGWATYNADHMSNYGVNCSIPKTLVRHLVSWVALNSVDEASKATLLDIVDTPISPELIPADENGNIKQKTEDLVGPYELHDFFLYNFMRLGFSPSKIYYLAQIAFCGKQKYDNINGLNATVGSYDKATILHWLKTFCRRFFTQQFKRSCLPDGPKVGSVSLSPRGDWRMPSDASSAEWLEECNSLE